MERGKDIDKERLKNDPEYRNEILMAMSARQHKRRYRRRLKFMIYVLVGTTLLSGGILIGGYLTPYVAEIIVTFIVCLFLVPLMTLMLVSIRNRKTS